MEGVFIIVIVTGLITIVYGTLWLYHLTESFGNSWPIDKTYFLREAYYTSFIRWLIVYVVTLTIYFNL